MKVKEANRKLVSHNRHIIKGKFTFSCASISLILPSSALGHLSLIPSPFPLLWVLILILFLNAEF
jgi:hypothetical protein